jgi:hypothetical protein
MKNLRAYLGGLALILVLLLPALACGFNVSTANIQSAVMARDSDGRQQTTQFSPNDTFFAIVEVANAPDDTSVSAIWVAVSVEGIDPNFFIDESEFLTGSGRVTFRLENSGPWPPGQYRVDIYLNDELDRSLSFQVQ